NGANTYTGATNVNGGIVKLGNAAALGGTAGNTVIASGATVDLNGQTIAEPFGTITGTGVGGNGALINTSGTTAFITGTMTQGAGVNFTVGAGDINLATVVTSSNTYTITKIGTGTFTLSGSSNNGFTGLTASGGVVVLGKTAA